MRRYCLADPRPGKPNGITYDLKPFDHTVVRGGDVPLDVLAKNVDDDVGRRPAR